MIDVMSRRLTGEAARSWHEGPQILITRLNCG
jgi:hypothetical protein